MDSVLSKMIPDERRADSHMDGRIVQYLKKDAEHYSSGGSFLSAQRHILLSLRAGRRPDVVDRERLSLSHLSVSI